MLLLLGIQPEDVNGVIISDCDIVGILVNEKGEQQGPAMYDSNIKNLKKRATLYFLEHGGHNVWKNGLELRIFNDK